MFNPFTVIALICLYVGILFYIALAVERRSSQGKDLGNNPLIYSLSLAVYCTSWTFYGSVGNAATSGLLFLAIYLGPTIAIILWWMVVRKIIRIKNTYRITSIADFISARYDNSPTIAAIATVMALAGIVPYMALQLKAVISSFGLLLQPAATGPYAGAGPHIGPLVVILMTVFTIIFGVRRLDPTERHQGMVVALAVESMVKLVAFLAVGIFVTYFLFNGFGDIFHLLAERARDNPASIGETGISSYLTWMTYLVLAMSAIIFLPRQFHIAVIENFEEKHLRTAMWLFPLYMFLINIFVYPIAKGGLLLGLPIQQADTFVLGLPLLTGQKMLSLLVFIGGFSAATGMIMISSMTMSTMITNHLMLPIVGQVRGLGFLRRHLLHCRWVTVALYISLSYWFERLVGNSLMLVNMGMISFVAALQFAPAILGGIFWRKGNRAGALFGLTSGFLVWFYTLIVPTLVGSGWLAPDVSSRGPWGIGFLRPEHLFHLTGLAPLSHALFWTMFFNISLYIFGSLIFEQTKEEQGLAEEFVHVLSLFAAPARLEPGAASIDFADKKDRLIQMLGQYFSEAQARKIFDQCLQDAGIDGQGNISLVAMTKLLKTVEKHLAGSIGAAAAHKTMISSAIFTPQEEQELAKVYAEILANLKLTPSDLKERIDFYQDREALLTRQGLELEEKIQERDREIEQRRRIEEALRASEEKYRSLVDNVNIGVYRNTGGPQGRFIQANPAIVKMFGYASVEEFMRVPVADLYQNPGDRMPFIEEARRQGFIRDKELPMRQKDGTPIWISCSVTVQFGADGDIKWLDGVMEDITERKKLEEQFRHVQKMEAVGTLAGGVAHDFNNILTAILGYGHLAKMRIKENDPLMKYIDPILTSAEKAANLTKSLLAFSRKQTINPKPLKVNDIVQGIEKILLRLIGEDIELKVQLAGEDLTVLGDSGQIEQVLMNLVTNARDAMPEGGALTIETSAREVSDLYSREHNLINPGRYAVLAVSDTGIGMDEKTQQRIFEPFFTTKEVGKGTGLGLSTVYGIIKQHSGELSVTSEAGKGTTISAYLPLVATAVKETTAETAVAPQGGTETILLAEDDREVRRLTSYVLAKYGYGIIEAVDGADAIAKFRENNGQVSLLILDVIMPKMNGKNVYEEIRKIRPDIKVLFASGYSADIMHNKGILEEGFSFISKPAPPDILLRKVRETLDRP